MQTGEYIAGKRKAAERRKREAKKLKPAAYFAQAQARGVIPGLLKTKGEEKKVLFSGQGTTGCGALALNSTGAIWPLNLIQVGSSMFNRIGRRLEMKSVKFTGFVTPLVATRASGIDYGRLIIVYDRQTNGAAPAITDVIQDTDQAGANTTTSMSGINMNNRERFVTIMDHRFYLPAVTNTAGALTLVTPTDTTSWKPLIQEYRNLRMLTTHYKADSNPAVFGDISTGALWIISLGIIAAASENFSINNWNCRLKYVDM